MNAAPLFPVDGGVVPLLAGLVVVIVTWAIARGDE